MRHALPKDINHYEYFYYRGFEGWLPLIRINTHWDLGYLADYEGYLYNPDYPIPTPFNKVEPANDIEAISNFEIEPLAHRKYIYHTVHYKNGFDIKARYYYNDGNYSRWLEQYELWGNSDYSWEVVYRGYVTSDLPSETKTIELH